MTVIAVDKSYKTQCKYCGLVKKSLVPGNFVCGKCKKFCEQQLTGEELKDRDYKTSIMISRNCLEKSETESKFLLNIFAISVSHNKSLSNQQYLSVCRILKRKS